MSNRDNRALLESLRRPDGWFTIGLVLLVCATLAWSLDDALLVLGQDQLTDFLFWAAMGGAAVGLIGPLVGWGRWTTHLVGAMFAAVLIPLLVGWAIYPAGGSLGFLFQQTTDEVVLAFSDLIVAQALSTPAYGHHLLVLGLITWGTAQFASYATFGHRRPINAVVVIGLLLIANMSLTVRPQLTFMVIFSIASLFLLVRFHTLDEQADWLRRRIGDPTAISALYLRGGTVFIIAAITASLALTAGASSAPLAGAWTDVAARVVDWGQFLERYLPMPPNAKGPGPSFTSTSPQIGSTWNTGIAEQLHISFPTKEDNPPFLAARYYDKFELRGWGSTEGAEVTPASPDDVLAGTAEDVPTEGRRELVATITPTYARREIFAPGLPVSVSSPVRLNLATDGGYLAAIERDISSDSYTITTLVNADEAQGGLTEEQLRVAGTEYPTDVVSLYGKGTVPPDAMGPESQKLLQQIVAATPNTDPYDRAVAIEATLRDPNEFIYDTDLTNNRCNNPSVVECFAMTRHGFCQYYASMMTIFLRELDIPARYVQGFLPGKPDPVGNSRTIRTEDSHAWVQAYFPGHGWIDFDPTGGPPRSGELAPIPSGPPVASGSTKPSGSASLIPEKPERSDPQPNGGLAGPFIRSGGPPAGLFIGIALLLAVIVGSVAAVAWRRSPHGPVSPNDVYGSVSRIATRLGFGPRPNQTVYEYAGSLADELPMVRPELETVAQAKVEVAYGGRSLGDDRLLALRAAHRRLRFQLFRLLPRRRGRKVRRRRR